MRGNAFKIDLPSDYRIHATFNVSDLTLFDIGDDQLNLSTSSKEEWSDEDFQEIQGYKEGIIIRSKVKRLQIRKS